MSTDLPVTDRTRLRRKPMRGSYDRAVIDAILDEALICHVGLATQHGPLVIPTAFVRVGDRLFIHGSTASHLLGALASGVDACVTVTLLDALVLGRTAIHHSVNYRSVIVFGRAELIDDPEAKLAALAALIDRVAPQRSAACRLPDRKELARTRVLGLPIAEASAKIRSGPPLPDEPEDAALPYWSGIVPLVTTRGAPINAPDCTLAWSDAHPTP
jgi:nitroimidazol reductase NimA-like FMN-containing flavoprotein (pyridoxamine 5'-phosphate oxidase superfamily)